MQPATKRPTASHGSAPTSAIGFLRRAATLSCSLRRHARISPSAARVGSRTKRKSPSRGLNRESFKFRTIQRFVIAILALVTTPASTARAQTGTTLKGNACPSETGRGILRDQSSNRRTVSTRSLTNSRSTSSRVSHVSGSSQPGLANRAKNGSAIRRRAAK